MKITFISFKKKCEKNQQFSKSKATTVKKRAWFQCPVRDMSVTQFKSGAAAAAAFSAATPRAAAACSLAAQKRISVSQLELRRRLMNNSVLCEIQHCVF